MRKRKKDEKLILLTFNRKINRKPYTCCCSTKKNKLKS